jgi:hypothetical protein
MIKRFLQLFVFNRHAPLPGSFVSVVVAMKYARSKTVYHCCAIGRNATTCNSDNVKAAGYQGEAEVTR